MRVFEPYLFPENLFNKRITGLDHMGGLFDDQAVLPRKP
ncbi:conserved hypothetical protein, partial [delta proteobacterium NaphS2]